LYLSALTVPWVLNDEGRLKASIVALQRLIYHHKELLVGLRMLQPLFEQFGRFHRVEAVQKSPDKKLLLAIGDFKTNGGSNPQVEAALDDLATKLAQSELIQQNFRVLTTSEADANKAIEQLAGRDLSAFRSPTQSTADKTQASKYPPESIYLISGVLYSSPEPMTHSVRVYLRVSFYSARTRLEDFRQQFTRTYMWHPDIEDWELQS